MGEKKTPVPFIASCDKFIYIEILRGEEVKLKENNKPSESKPKVEMEEVDLLNLLNQSIDDWADDEGWAFLGNVGNHILKKYPDFDPRNYHYKKLSTLLESFGEHFTIEKRDAYQPIKLVYVKRKETSSLNLNTIAETETADSDIPQDEVFEDSDVQKESMMEMESDLAGDSCTNVDTEE